MGWSWWPLLCSAEEGGWRTFGGCGSRVSRDGMGQEAIAGTDWLSSLGDPAEPVMWGTGVFWGQVWGVDPPSPGGPHPP